MKPSLRIWIVACACLTGLAACSRSSSVPGSYTGANSGNADCIWEQGEKRITLNSFGSPDISLAMLEGSDLEGDMGDAVVRFKKG